MAIGTIIATYLGGGDYKKIVSFLKVTGVPVNSRELGVPGEKMARDALIKTGVI